VDLGLAARADAREPFALLPEPREKALLTPGDPDHDMTVRRYGWRYSAVDGIHNVMNGG
jgi:hypothetical protein